MACLSFLCLVQGDVPPVEIALELYSILSESDTNLRQPVGLENQLMKNSLGSEVGQSILQLLQVRISLLLFLHSAMHVICRQWQNLVICRVLLLYPKSSTSGKYTFNGGHTD